MPSLSSYRLTWVSLTLDVGYLFMAAPAKRSRGSLPLTWGVSSWPWLVTLDVGYLLGCLLLQCALIRGPNIPVPMEYCSLQHWTFLPSPVTATTVSFLLWFRLFILF